MLTGQLPEEVVRWRLAAKPKLANIRFELPDPHALPVVAHAKEVSHPDTSHGQSRLYAAQSRSSFVRNSCYTFGFSLGAPIGRRNEGENDVDGESD